MPRYCYVYVRRSLEDRQFYVGLTRDLPSRVQAYNARLVSSTKRRVPFELVYWQGCLNASDAAQREKYLKTAWGQALHQNAAAEVSHGVNLDFIVPGAQKSGTTALHYFLKKHPQIALPDRQEMHFFDDEEVFSQQPVDYELLHQHFRTVAKSAVSGEVTPSYLYWKPAMERIANYNPLIKLVILLRNPIDRAFAHWNMQRFKDREPLDFLDALKEEPRRIAQPLSIESRRFAYVDRGFYSGQLERVFTFFPREQQVHIVKFENFRDRKQETLDSIFDFLGVKRIRSIRDKDRNVVPYERAITNEERKYLAEVFAAEIAKLEQMLGWDLSDWR
jgi:predicted GIY-YIG superfamily endonuclease